MVVVILELDRVEAVDIRMDILEHKEIHMERSAEEHKRLAVLAVIQVLLYWEVLRLLVMEHKEVVADGLEADLDSHTHLMERSQTDLQDAVVQVILET